MLTLGFIQEVQDCLDDPKVARYPLATIVRHGDRQLRGMFRSMSVANKDYSNFTYCAKGADARVIFKGGYEWRLPSWIEAIAQVNYREGTATVQTSFSPYRWTADTVGIGNLIPRDARDPYPRWSWEGNNTLKVWNCQTPPELVIRCIKRPSKMFYGRIATLHASQGSLYLPAPINGEVEIEEGSYVNADFQVTTTASTNALQYGDIRRCIYSNAAAVLVSSRVHELVFDSNWTATLAVNDEIQTVLPLPDEQTRYLVLRTAFACMQKQGATLGMSAIAGEMAEEGQRFKNTIQPRDAAGPRRWITRGYRNGRPYDAEHFYRGYGYPW